MKKMGRPVLVLVWIVLLFTTLSGCTAAKTAGLSDDQVANIAENILEAINEDNYPRFIQDMSDTMKSMFDISQFNVLRYTLQTASGDYLSKEDSTLTDSQGYAVYRFLCTFAREQVVVTITFAIGGDQVEGLFFDSPNLRSISQ